VNSIPSQVQLEIDVRDIDQDRRDGVLRQIESAAKEVSSRRHVSFAIERINADPPAKCAPEVVGQLTEACQQHGMRWEPMISRAYHDSLFMSRIAPTAMLFVPCRGGVSHRPDEYSSPEAIAKGVLVLAAALARLRHRLLLYSDRRPRRRTHSVDREAHGDGVARNTGGDANIQLHHARHQERRSARIVDNRVLATDRGRDRTDETL